MSEHDPLRARTEKRPYRPLQGFAAAYGWGLRLAIGRRRRLLLITLGGALLGFLMGTQGVARRGRVSNDEQASYYDLWQALDETLIPFIVPLVALTLVAGAFQREVSERTLVFHLVRPISRRTLYLARYLAGVTVAVPMALVPLVATLAFCGAAVPSAVWTSLPLTVALGVLINGAIYMLLSAWLRYGIIAGLIYTFVLESFVASSAGAVQRLSALYYTLSVHHGLTDDAFAERSSYVRTALRDGERGSLDPERALKSVLEAGRIPWMDWPAAVLTLGIITTVVLAVGLWHVGRKDYPLKD